jgi:hypothetical protein
LSAGEFGSALRFIFDPASAAEFHAEVAEQVRNRPVVVFSYAVDVVHSHYALKASTRVILTPYHGRVYIDEVTGSILRLTMNADPPPDFPIQFTSTAVDYDFRKIGETDYLLPVHADVQASDPAKPAVTYRNMVEFRDYRKFSANSKVTFGQ